ncbi:MAG: prepilin-type N-terminal cleavage/methylation domain-containing protein, partial [Edaphobacter sp.]
MKKTMTVMDRLHAARLDTRGRGERSSEEGFTLIELLIVMSVMLIIMTLAIPQLLKLTKQAHETSAVASVRAISEAQLQYNSAYPANGFACSLSVLGGDPKSGAPSAQSAQLIGPDLATGQKAGYSFAITNCSKVTINNQDMYTSYEITAVPSAVGKTGDRG